MATTARKRNLCSICGTRTVGSGGKRFDTQTAASVGTCGPCYEEAGWENTHSDWGHDAKAETVVEGDGENEQDNRVKGCWICFPELNEAQREYKPRTSKGGKAGAARKARRPQLNHRTQCMHPQTPEARRECRKAFWAAEAAKAEQASKGKGTRKAK